MESVEFKNRQSLKLRGIFQKGTNGRLIIMCHGFRSNRSSRGRFDRFAKTFNKLGYHVLRFDFGGCGESENRPLSVAGEIADLKAAIQYAVSNGFTEIILYGHSLGARICLECYHPRYIIAMILTGAGTGPVLYDWGKEFSPSQLEELRETGNMRQPVQDPFREEVMISEQMLLDFEEVNQYDLLSRITCPTLLIHGDQGEEEILMPLTKKGMKWLPSSSRLHIIEGAPHSFEGYLDQVEQKSIEWLKEQV
ncbi:alpha/beta hydrolase [Halobacillus karajensis]|uniref:Exosortase A system-associated hydrolase 1 n=1 Tax=Halobacillus karajensis TaxID=195088 RepID=A0A059NX52_9BACI|nr:alpha/beta hydrolase [Halobacillus karajensis]CDQ18650.1 exosortase A system-associated hydrolase 1 [Halobacillus karajensis]CDQ23278.1 exosortase A system-associated hydrolase 1 [Halobacillus karajensis]CDQ26760.1 exosortase A system-associated hydrolase 1 [Halobacillus karajensis]